ncbi:hypothetical protein ACQ4LE_000494 [Meloidogyne hapla]|uniref:Protein PTCD3 homolog, mitochondrial n=1 Tax=Meloidogyne hapla TaxID=6305 RepID=A0A1I8BEA1_MELHA
MSTPLSFIYRSPIYRFYALSILQRNFHTGEYPFKIPAPIKRSSTDILQALADTVKTDETAHHFAYIDDPSTIPTSISQRRLYLLAKEYGRRTAIRLVEEWPTLFMLDRDQPRLAAFRPQKPLNPELVEPTEQNLLHMISTRQVTDALKLYERMGENAENIEINAQMELFKLLCYYNEENIPLDEFEWAATRIYYSQEEERNNEWKGLKNEGPCLAEKLFDKLPKTEETYSYLICGLCKFPTVYSLTQAKILYKEMISAGFTPFEDVFNLMIKNEISLDEDAKFDLNFWLQEMSRHNVRPTVTTFNCIFENLAKKVDSDNSDDSSDTYFIDNSKKKENLWNSAKMFINEMKALNIEPSLNIYAKIIEISPEDVSYRVALLNEIFTNLEEKLSKRNEIKNSNLDDQTFFLNSLSIASTAQSESLLDRTLEIYNDRNNKVKIVSTFDEPRFFENYLIAKLCCLTLNNFFLVYKKFVPNIVPLTPILFGTISDHITKRKPDEFCWPLLKRLAENFMNSRCISMDKFGAFMLEQLREVRPNQHLSREEAKEYFKLCDKIINLIEEIDRNRELRKAKDEFKLKEKEGILEEDLLLENQKDSKEEEILENVLSNEFYVEDKSHY